MICRCAPLDDWPTHVPLPWLSPQFDRAGSRWGSQGPGQSSSPPGEKTVCGVCGRPHWAFYDHRVRRVRDLSWGDTRIDLEVELRRVWCQSCGTVKQEQLRWLADRPFCPKRFAFFVGRRCRGPSLRAVARELRRDGKTVKELDKQYMRAQLRRAGTPAPQVLGSDEIAIGQGHTYQIVVSDLVRRRAIWFGGLDRSEASLDVFSEGLGTRKSGGFGWR